MISKPVAQQRYDRFRPGQVWLDTAGRPIQAHAGSLIKVDGAFYWYGENKEFTDGKSGIESWGIRFYRCGKSLKQEAGDRVGFVYDKTRSFVPWYRESRKSKEQQTLARKPRGANAFLLQQIVWSNAF